MSPGSVRTRLCIISDTHTIPPFPSTDTKHVYRHPFPTSDVLLHCGDITKIGHIAEYEAILDFLKQAPAELKLVIAGNHDITLHKELYLERLKNKHRNIPIDVDAVRELWTGDEARANGIVYLEEGVRTFNLSSGARFTVSGIEFALCVWIRQGLEEMHLFEEPPLEKHVTHSCGGDLWAAAQYKIDV